MLRRALLLIPLALCFAADPAGEAAAVISELAAALAARDAQEFLARFDPKFPEREKLAANVAALVAAQADTQSYLDIVSNEGDDRTRSLELTWELRVQRSG